MIIIIIPAFNEAKWIKKVVGEVKAAGYQVVVVDDCSKDNTAALAEKAGAAVLRHVINRGQGAALRTGTNWAIENGAKIIVHFDADGQFRIEDIARVIKPVISGKADVVFGSRFLDHSTKLPWAKRFLIMPLARLVNQVLFGVRLTDPQSGFRAFTAEVGKNLKWRQDRMAHASEILAQIIQGRWRIVEVPITVIYHEFGQGFSGGLKILKDIFIKKLS
ncbi:MAG: Glycosyl transferase, family 2 [Candidatus Uhrbacteria bacterium GW2011_GWE2_45_35]|uniref:Glycosyl transferase, family 2 n=2 Tax=Candidatus Uhriibacteriota TaxID=1752732 RepID=A0A0G1LT02_9BACT|nr:MAG: Glycosyl transferase, family 2 [Candidatus Uhrbacteria bacterium GW2011_GWF2_44_350]KKU09169.1 MAG: Glycosyl transferase, family 2 [Candidatus Uhrbacteria bacterium GW2011_GWE2_45_35]HCU31201.1 glycosyltransferase family 2 protein [Candidatus Uhrbacteria bacterium]